MGKLLGWQSQQLSNVKDACFFYTPFATHNVVFALRQQSLEVTAVTHPFAVIRKKD